MVLTAFKKEHTGINESGLLPTIVQNFFFFCVAATTRPSSHSSELFFAGCFNQCIARATCHGINETSKKSIAYKKFNVTNSCGHAAFVKKPVVLNLQNQCGQNSHLLSSSAIEEGFAQLGLAEVRTGRTGARGLSSARQFEEGQQCGCRASL